MPQEKQSFPSSTSVALKDGMFCAPLGIGKVGFYPPILLQERVSLLRTRASMRVSKGIVDEKKDSKSETLHVERGCRLDGTAPYLFYPAATRLLP